MERFKSIARISSEIEAGALEAVLIERKIPHVIRSFHDSAYDGLFQVQQGWGRIEGPASREAEIIQILESIQNQTLPDDEEIDQPDEFDWRHWVERWERMQDRYLVMRRERFEMMIRLIEGSQGSINRILDLGCGPGSLMVPLLEAFPATHLVGIDLDPTILQLARKRLAQYGNRARIVQADLRDPCWLDRVPGPFNAIVSATSLHWFNPKQLELLYLQLPDALAPGGIFLNADHVISECGPLQETWEKRREEMLAPYRLPDVDDWCSFWDAYLDELGGDAREIRARALGAWESSDKGLPLAWHLDQLNNAAFNIVDCFWRRDCDAIYGAIAPIE